MSNTPSPAQVRKMIDDLVQEAGRVRAEYADAYDLLYHPGRGRSFDRPGRGSSEDAILNHVDATSGTRGRVREAARQVEIAYAAMGEAYVQLRGIYGEKRAWIAPASRKGKGRDKITDEELAALQDAQARRRAHGEG